MAALNSRDPGSVLKGRFVPHMLIMTTVQFGYPVALCVNVKTDDRLLHVVSDSG